jgi:hypothetical protein
MLNYHGKSLTIGELFYDKKNSEYILPYIQTKESEVKIYLYDNLEVEEEMVDIKRMDLEN